MRFLHWLNNYIIGRMTSALKMLVQKGIIIFGLCDSTIVLTKSFCKVRQVCPTYCILQLFVFQERTYTGSIDFQSKSESLTNGNVLPFTDEVTVVLEHK